MSKKQPIHISDEWLREIDELAGLLGMTPQVYGYIPKTLRFGITYTLTKLKDDEKVIPSLKQAETALWLSSVTKLREKRLLKEKGEKALEMAEKV